MAEIAPPELAAQLEALADDPSGHWARTPHVWIDVLAPDSGDLKWALMPEGELALRGCRFTVGPDRKQCGRPAVVRLQRGMLGRWWAYCELPEHLYGRVFLDGRLWQRRWVDD